MTEQQMLIVGLYGAAVTVLGAHTAFFVLYEWRVHGFQVFRDNKFVGITLAASAFHLVSLALFVPYMSSRYGFITAMESSTVTAIVFSRDFFFLVSHAMHVALVYFRS